MLDHGRRVVDAEKRAGENMQKIRANLAPRRALLFESRLYVVAWVSPRQIGFEFSFFYLDF